MIYYVTIYRGGAAATRPYQHGQLSDAGAFLEKITAPLPKSAIATAVATGDKTDLPAWGPYELLPESTRSDTAVVQLTALVLDYDQGDGAEAVEALVAAGWAVGYHTSWSHTPEHPKYRVILPLAAPVPASLWGSFWTREIEKIPGAVDRKCRDISRQYFMFAARDGSHLSGYSLGRPWPVVFEGLTPNFRPPSAAPTVAPPVCRELPDEDLDWLASLVGVLEPSDLSALVEGRPLGSPGQWQAAYTRVIPRLANAFMARLGRPPRAEDLWRYVGATMSAAHIDDCWRFCCTIAQDRALVVTPAAPSDRAPAGGGVPDEAVYARVSRIRAKTRIVPPEVEAVRVILEDDPRWRGRVSYDTLNSAVAIDGAPVDDLMVDSVRGWLYRVYGIERLGKDTTISGLTLAARALAVDPVVNWLNSLPPWDGVDRLSSWCERYAAGVGPPTLLSWYGRGFFVGLVARQFDPVVQADNVLTLWGSEGIRKSSLLRTILPERSWFSDSKIDIEDNKRLHATLGGKVLVEWPELSAVRKADVEVVKAFLTSQVDRFTPMYSRFEVTRPRRVMFAGSLNKTNFIPQAGRRWWVFEVAGVCDDEGMARDREMIFAEALVRYRRGEQWHLPAEFEPIQASEARKFALADEWHETASRFTTAITDRTRRYTLTELASRVGLTTRPTSNDERRLQSSLRSLGWVRADDGYWVPPR